MYTRIEYEKKGKVAVLAINQTHDNNRINRETMQEMVSAMADAEQDKAIAVVVLTGKGDYFCTGGRMNGFPDGLTMDIKGFADAFIELQRTIYRFKKPVIAAVQGNAVAGGLSLVESCDLAVAGRDCKFGLPELKRGNFPMLALAIMQKALPKKLVFEMAYRAELIDAQTALEWNLINLVVDQDKVLEKAVEWGDEIAALNGVAVSFGREAYYKMVNMNLDAALDYGKGMLIGLLTTEDVKEADYAIKENRAPVFKGV